MYPQQSYPPQPAQGYPQYAPQPGYPAPGSAMPELPAPAPVMPNFVDPSGGGGGDWSPLPRHLIGYAAAILPTAYDPNNPGPNNSGVKPQITIDFVLVGVDPQGNPLPPVEFGDNQSRNAAEQRPNCFRLDAFPAEFRGARWTNEAIVNTLKSHVGTGNIVLGRFRQGDQGNRPPLLEVLAPTDAARQALAAAWQQRAQDPASLRRTVGNGIVEINGGPPKKDVQGAPAGMPPQPGSAYAQAPVAQYGPYAGQPMPQTGHVMAQQGQWGGPVAPPGAQVQYAAPPPPPQPGPPQAGGMPQAAAQAGWTPEAWAAAPPQVKAAFGG